jgi:hypothetical protein
MMTLAEPLRLENLRRPQSRVPTYPIKTLPRHVQRLKHLMGSVRLSENPLRVTTGTMGDLMENQDGTHWLKPRQIHQGYFNRMMNGQVPIPDWRMGQMVTICEFVAAIRIMEIREGHPDAKVFAGLLKTMPNALSWFMKQPEYRVWIERFRFAIFNRVKLDRDKSAYDEAVYSTYNEYLKKADGQMDPESTSEKAEEAGDDADLQTPA